MRSELITYENGNIQTAKAVTEGLFDRYLRFLDASEKTKEAYTKALRQFFKYLQITGTTEPTRETIINYKNYLAFHEDENGKIKKLAPATIQLYLIAVKQFFKWTYSENLYPNIAENIKAPKVEKLHKKDHLSARQAKSFLSTIDKSTDLGLRDYAIIALTISCGLRDIEISRANIEDLSTAGGQNVLYIQGKGRDEKAEFVKLPPQVVTAINSYLETRKGKRPEQPLFTGIGNRNLNGRLTTKTISRMIKGRLIKAGFESDRITAHSLRHTAVTLALLEGKSIFEVQQFARHKNINTTMIYNHAITAEQNSCSEAVASVIF